MTDSSTLKKGKILTEGVWIRARREASSKKVAF
jgi:hypothetical protein